jgi:hypothetical protein
MQPEVCPDHERASNENHKILCGARYNTYEIVANVLFRGPHEPVELERSHATDSPRHLRISFDRIRFSRQARPLKIEGGEWLCLKKGSGVLVDVQILGVFVRR